MTPSDREAVLKAHPLVMHFVNLDPELDPIESLDELMTFVVLSYREGKSFETCLNEQSPERRAELIEHCRIVGGAA